MKNSPLVYSTDKSKEVCPRCGHLDCICKDEKKQPFSGQTVHLKIDRKGRKGKSMTLITGIKGNPQQKNDLAKQLKQHLGAGGTVKQGIIEIQGDHRDKISQFLQSLGMIVKFSGG